MLSQNFQQTRLNEDVRHDECPGVQLVVKNTFFDCGETQSGLLNESEREDLLLTRGSRKARTCFVLPGAVPAPASPLASPLGEGTTVIALGPELRQRRPLLRKSITWAQVVCDDEGSGGCAGAEDQEQAWPSQLSHDPSEFALASSVTRDHSEASSTCSTEDTNSVSAGFDREGGFHQDGEAVVLQFYDDLATAATLDAAAVGHLGQGEPGDQTSGDADKVVGLLSVGSAGHSRGDCKPCAFLDSKKGCFAGVNCVYCHACDVHEKKRRQKERRKMLSSMRRLQQSQQEIVIPER
mmetsp:Transcript_80435/g.209080  ORF Transcript_80435/g.209080 Transcript_80435/m.209080 type:complete len:295 (+) Transcript_80435:73-957(+)